jgi:hypothetical protein
VSRGASDRAEAWLEGSQPEPCDWSRVPNQSYRYSRSGREEEPRGLSRACPLLPTCRKGKSTLGRRSACVSALAHRSRMDSHVEMLARTGPLLPRGTPKVSSVAGQCSWPTHRTFLKRAAAPTHFPEFRNAAALACWSRGPLRPYRRHGTAHPTSGRGWKRISDAGRKV